MAVTNQMLFGAMQRALSDTSSYSFLPQPVLQPNTSPPAALRDNTRLMLVEEALKRMEAGYDEKLGVMQQNIDDLAQDNASLRTELAAHEAFVGGYKRWVGEQLRFLTGCIQGAHAEAVALRSRVTELTTLVEKLMQDPSSVGDSGITIVSDMHGTHSRSLSAATWQALIRGRVNELRRRLVSDDV